MASSSRTVRPVMRTTPAPDLRQVARELAPAILAAEDSLENERRMPPELVDALWEAGVFRMFTPAEVGGLEVDLLEWLELIEELSRLNGSGGWEAFIPAGGTGPRAGGERPGPGRGG